MSDPGERLDDHEHRISRLEAQRIADAPIARYRTYAILAGAFFGSAVVAVVVEVLRRM